MVIGGPRAGTALVGILTAALAISACNQASSGVAGEGSSSKSDATTILPDSAFRGDRSTPDRAVLSWWSLIDRADSLAVVAYEDTTSVWGQQSAILERAQRSALGGTALATIDHPDTRWVYAREIVDVKQQTDTRAVVLAKIRNITPIPPGATPDEFDIKNRREGTLVRYTLDKDAMGWRIVQAEQKSSVGEDWYPRYNAAPVVPSIIGRY